MFGAWESVNIGDTHCVDASVQQTIAGADVFARIGASFKIASAKLLRQHRVDGFESCEGNCGSHGVSLLQRHAVPSFYILRGYVQATIFRCHVDLLICSKLCCIYALPSKTDFKARTARFEFEGTSVWKVVESEKVLVLFCFCSSWANSLPIAYLLSAFGDRWLSGKMPGLLGGRNSHLLGYLLGKNDLPKNGLFARVLGKGRLNSHSFCDMSE
jgi:hypothetical protein